MRYASVWPSNLQNETYFLFPASPGTCSMCGITFYVHPAVKTFCTAVVKNQEVIQMFKRLLRDRAEEHRPLCVSSCARFKLLHIITNTCLAGGYPVGVICVSFTYHRALAVDSEERDSDELSCLWCGWCWYIVPTAACWCRSPTQAPFHHQCCAELSISTPSDPSKETYSTLAIRPQTLFLHQYGTILYGGAQAETDGCPIIRREGTLHVHPALYFENRAPSAT